MPKQVLIELDAETAARFERAAPAGSRRRAEFVRAAILRALWDLEERDTRAAYLRDPDTEKAAWPEPPWGPWTTCAILPGLPLLLFKYPLAELAQKLFTKLAGL